MTTNDPTVFKTKDLQALIKWFQTPLQNFRKGYVFFLYYVLGKFTKSMTLYI
jgi:hypothetical protein